MSPTNTRTSESLANIDPSWGMKIEPFVWSGTMAGPIGDQEELCLDGGTARRMIDFLVASKWAAAMEAHLHGLYETADGKVLLTAIITPHDCRNLCHALGLLCPRVRLAAWIEDGCNEVAVHFLDGRAQKANDQ